MNPDMSTARMCGFDSKVSIVVRGGSTSKMGTLESMRVRGVPGVEGGVEATGLGTRVEADVEGDVEP